MTRAASTVVVALLLSLGGSAPRAQPAAAAQEVSAVPVDPIPALVEAARSHSLVAIGDAHGNEQGLAFQSALISDPQFSAVVNDILVELGNSAFQDVLDRFIRGEHVAEDQLRRVWRDTAQQQLTPWNAPQLFTVVRQINAARAPDQRFRVLLGEPSIDWNAIQTAEDLRKWQSDPARDRDRFAADLLRREVFEKGRRALSLYGAGHFFRRNVSHSLVSLVEGAGPVKAFTVWTNAAADMATMQADVATWRIPSLAMVRGTVLGRTPFELFFGPAGGDIPTEWKVPMQDQFDAVLYLGPRATITFARAERWPCGDPAFAERLRRAALIRAGLAERLKKECLAP